MRYVYALANVVKAYLKTAVWLCDACGCPNESHSLVLLLVGKRKLPSQLATVA